MSWHTQNKAAIKTDVLVCTGTYHYVLVCTCIYWYVRVHTCMYWYVLISLSYRPVHASMYKYIQVHTRTYSSLPSLKKVRTGLEPEILCIPHQSLPLRYGSTDLNAAVSGEWC